MAWRSTAPSVSVERQEGARFARCRAGNLVPFDDDRPRAAPAAEIGDCGADHATAAGFSLSVFGKTGPPAARAKSSKNSKANRIETGERSGGIWTNLFGGSKKIAKKIAKNKRCYANTLRPRSRMLLKVLKGG
jgi:hypothetical protein